MKKFVWIFLILVIIVGFSFLIRYYYGMIISDKIYIEKALAEFREEISPVRIKVTEKAKGIITVQLKFYNLDGEAVGIVTREIPGNTVFIDFTVIKVKGSFFFFPVALFSDKIPPAQGIPIASLYEAKRYPKIYSGNNVNLNFRRLVQNVWDYIQYDKADEDVVQYFGNALHQYGSPEMSDENTVYYIICHTKQGGIEMQAK